jgi:hypothetical protein
VQRTTRIVAVATTAAALVAALAAPSLSATRAGSTPTPTTKDPAAAAAGYLARQLQGPHHDHYTVTFSGTVYPNYGETADAVLSMDAAGVAQTAAQRATAYLAKNVSGYAAGSPTFYPGPVAKLMLVAVAQHRNVRSFGGVDLVAKLQAAEGAGDAQPGEYQQNPGFPGGTSYLVSQALPVLALAIAPGAPQQPSAAAVSFLAGQQCGDGGFQSTVRPDTGVACSGEDVDSTGYAVQALLAAGAKGAAASGLTWLRQARNSDGGYGNPSNANSTALAVEALIAGHLRASHPIAWLRSHQVGCTGKPSRRGAVKFQDKYDGSALLATSQAGAALARKPLAWIDRAGAQAAAPFLACRSAG